MPARDILPDVVKEALIKDGWIVIGLIVVDAMKQ
jgi:hypothetical protein